MVEVDLTWLLGLFGAGALAVYLAFRYRLKQVRVLFEQMAEAVGALDDALADDKLFQEELVKVWNEFLDIYYAIKEIVKPKEEEPSA